MKRISALVVIQFFLHNSCLGDAVPEPPAKFHFDYVPPTTHGPPIYKPPTTGPPIYKPPTTGPPIYGPPTTNPPIYTPTPPNGLYTPPPPPPCVNKKISFDFKKILVTQTTRLPPITDVITLAAEMAHISVQPVWETLTIFKTHTQEPNTINVMKEGFCRVSQPVDTSIITLELTTTVTADPIVEIKPWKEIEWETVPPVTDTVTVTTTLPKDINMHTIVRYFTHTVVLPTSTSMSTISVTTTEMLPAIIKTMRLGYTKTMTVSAVTEQHAPITMMAPPLVSIYRIDITQTSIPPAVSKMVMYTTTVEEEKPCGYYSKGVPTKAFTHGRGQTQAIDFGLPIF